MVKKCSHCGHNGDKSRTCMGTRGMAGGGGVKLFGVQLHMASSLLEKSFSMECLSCSYPFAPSSSSSSSTSSLGSVDEATEKTTTDGYLSDGLGGRTQERKKGVSWTEEEHRQFLVGLEKLGKGDWRGISRNFVNTRTPTQVASHAQKYFLRQNSLNKKKCRSSLFDVVAATCEKAALHTDPYKSELEMHDPVLLSLCTMANQNASETEPAKVDLSSLIQEWPSSAGLIERDNAQLSHIDLELRISSSKLNQKNSSTGDLCFGTIRVT